MPQCIRQQVHRVIVIINSSRHMVRLVKRVGRHAPRVGCMLRLTLQRLAWEVPFGGLAGLYRTKPFAREVPDLVGCHFASYHEDRVAWYIEPIKEIPHLTHPGVFNMTDVLSYGGPL